MARPQKKGLDYFPFDVDFFSDKKIKRLRSRFGTDGISVYIYLLCEIYRSGYYIDYDEDLIYDISDELNISEHATTQIMNYLLSRSLFNDTLAKSVKVLTAASIQRRYQEAKKGGKRDVEVEAEFWVLKKDETLSFIKVRHAGDNSRNKHSFSGNYSGFSENNGIKKSKVNKSKENESKEKNYGSSEAAAAHKQKYGEYRHVALTSDQYNNLVLEYGKDKTDLYIKKIDEWVQLKGKPYKDYNLAVRNWLNRDNESKAKSESEHSYDLDDFKSLVNSFGGKNG